MGINSKVTIDAVQAAVERAQVTLDSPGFCVSCGAEHDGVEPDARRYECEFCNEPAVYGAEELLIRMVA